MMSYCHVVHNPTNGRCIITTALHIVDTLTVSIFDLTPLGNHSIRLALTGGMPSSEAHDASPPAPPFALGLTCRVCSAELLHPVETPRRLLPLPSARWHEMADFINCGENCHSHGHGHSDSGADSDAHDGEEQSPHE